MDEDPDEWQRLRREQDGVFGVAQLAALLFVPGPAVLSHSSAAAVLGLRGGDDSLPVHLTAPFTASGRGCRGIVVHRSRAFAHIVLRGSDPPVTTAVHTVIDLSVAASGARAAMRALTAGATAGRLDGALVLGALERRPPPRYRRALEEAARLLVDGVMSVLEADYALNVEGAHRLPPCARQVPRIVEGRRVAEDLEYAMPRGTLTVRLDGWAYHRDRRTAHRDRLRDNAAEIDGRDRLSFGTEEVQGAPCATARTVARRLTQLGWTGEVSRCPACVHFPSP